MLERLLQHQHGKFRRAHQVAYCSSNASGGDSGIFSGSFGHRLHSWAGVRAGAEVAASPRLDNLIYAKYTKVN